MQSILLTGATGYIRRRLLQRLQADPEVTLRLLVRHPETLMHDLEQRVQIVKGSTFEPEALRCAMEGIDTAYYLIHSLGSDDYAQKDRQSAPAFRDAAIDVIWFRAGVIIGSGSASFEIVRNLIEKLPIMITPRWVRTMAQPIGVEDVLHYLDDARHIKGTHVVDIGVEAMCYQSMIVACTQMKVPGKAYLEFRIEEDRLIQSANFLPRGLWGRLYWNLLIPIHALIFANMLRAIIREARLGASHPA